MSEWVHGEGYSFGWFSLKYMSWFLMLQREKGEREREYFIFIVSGSDLEIRGLPFLIA